jgi:hypothetical protein
MARKARITMKDIKERVTIEGERYGITIKGEIYSLLRDAKGRERIAYHINDEAGYSLIWNKIRFQAIQALS